MRGSIYLLPALFLVVFGAPQARCPDGCKCATSTSEYMARCTSLEFFDSLDSKKYSAITSLDLSNLSLDELPQKLRKMKSLKKLDLTGNTFTSLANFPKLNKLTHLSLHDNQLHTFDAHNLPNSIIDLDLSQNQIVSFKGLAKLPKLKTLHLEGNYIECDCAFAKTIDVLTNKFSVSLVDTPKCSSPSKLRDVAVSRVYCVNGVVLFDDDMHNDEPIEDEYMPSNANANSEGEEEGSGASGDGGFIVESDVPNCHFNCSTPTPVTDDDSLPRADIGKELIDVLRGTTTVENQEEEEEEEDVPVRDPVEEEVAVRTQVRKVEVTPDEVAPKEEGLDKSNVQKSALPTDLPATSQSPKSNSTTYIIVGALLLVMVGLIAYVVIKKKKARPQVETPDKVAPVEMKPLMSKSNGNDANTTIPERTPLMNGQNGHTENGDAVKQADLPDDQVDVRPKADDDSGIIPERVTVTAKELSSPKSPVLVQRRLEDDGRIVDHIVDHPGKS